VFVATILFVCGAGIWHAISIDDVVANYQPNDLGNGADKHQVSDVTLPATKKAGEPSQPKSHEILDKFNKARNYRAYINDILMDPSKGGLGYAAYALFKCKQASDLSKKTDSLSAMQVTAAATLVARCDLSDSDQEDLRNRWVYERNVNIGNDPDLKLTIALANAQTGTDKSAAIAAIMHSGDPSIMPGILSPQALPGAQDGAQRGIFFQNQWYEGDQGISMINSAMDLAMCQLGTDCGADSTHALVACIEKGWCGNSVADGARQQLNSESPDKFDQVSALAAQIIQQINAGNASAFVYN
jgi:hypothetical protein